MTNNEVIFKHETQCLEHEDAVRQEEKIKQKQGKEIIEDALILVGQTRAFHHIKQYTDLAVLATLKRVKEIKSYRKILDGTWEGYCLACGVKLKTIDEQLLRLERLGIKMLETAQKARVTHRDLRRLEALPADTRTQAVDKILDVKNPTKEQIRELIDRIEGQFADNALLEDKNSKLEEKLAKREAVIVKGGLQCKEMEDEMLAMKKEMGLVLIKDNERRSIERLADAKKKFEVALVHIFTVDLDKATPAVRGAVVSLYEYMRVLIKQYFVEIAAKYPELGAEMEWEPPGQKFKNMWGPDEDDDISDEAEGKTAVNNKQ